MNKHLLTLAWLLSLLAVNQAFGWDLTVKNETANLYTVQTNYYMNMCFEKQTVSVKAGQTVSIKIDGSKCMLQSVSVRDSKNIEVITEFKLRQSKYGRAIEPDKGLTIKTGSDGKPFIVENQ